MSNPLIAQGTLNRLRGSVIFSSFPQLNVTAPFLDPDGIGLVLEGEATTIIRTMTGIVTSPEPFQLVTVNIHLLRTQPLANIWKSQQQSDTRIGDCVVRPDAVTLSPYQIFNAAIQSVGELRFNGTVAGYGVSIQGYWTINDVLWSEGL